MQFCDVSSTIFGLGMDYWKPKGKFWINRWVATYDINLDKIKIVWEDHKNLKKSPNFIWRMNWIIENLRANLRSTAKPGAAT